MNWSGQISISSITERIKRAPCSPVMKESSAKSRRQSLFPGKSEISLTRGAEQELVDVQTWAAALREIIFLWLHLN